MFYGVFTAWKPSSLLNVTQLEPRGKPSRSGRALASVIGARDTLSGLSMLPNGLWRSRGSHLASRA
jgi:hypothetical protein